MTSKDPGAATNRLVQVVPNSSSRNSPGTTTSHHELEESHSPSSSKEDVGTEAVDGEQSQFDHEDTPVEQIEVGVAQRVKM